eukprot:CAMPEP_0184306446 /NCGR_PEP_ID=MMETSP1049-20130417/15439_1 /TAXON_ID=77928 /ORGANISM="Proteomonas sulcata, Strain CCMP704" /LENGTH=45 /DNA_ID= /DNA_START= /DNA_END= /DNA_ORIENTATION=
MSSDRLNTPLAASTLKSFPRFGAPWTPSSSLNFELGSEAEANWRF